MRGSNTQLDWFRTCIAHRFEVKFRGRLGPNSANRIVQWIDSGISYEVDQRHAEIIVQELGLSRGAKAVTTPSAVIVHEDDTF